VLSPDDRVESGGKLFCRSCYETLRQELHTAVARLSEDVNYAGGVTGAVLGAALGALVWWGFTVATRISLGLIAVAIGFLAGMGAVRFSGGKRSGGLQLISIAAASLAYLVATYLVNMTFINRELAQAGETFRIGFPPQNLGVASKVLTAGFGVMDIVFFAIVVYEAWKIPRPIRIPAAPGA
jgi:hypothetical protein